MRAAVVLAAGSGSRLAAGQNKVWLEVAGQPVITWSLQWLEQSQLFDRYVVVVPEAELAVAAAMVAPHCDLPIEWVAGGSSRHGSETNALEYLADDIESGELSTVLIHDGARPLALPQLIQAVVAAAESHGGALPGLAADDLLGPPTRGELVKVQTPQAFEAKALLSAYRAASAAGFEGTDTSACVERFAPQLPIAVVRATADNLKITYSDDLAAAELKLRALR